MTVSFWTAQTPVTIANGITSATKTIYSNSVSEQARLSITRNDVNQSYFLRLHLTNLDLYHPNGHQNQLTFGRAFWKACLKLSLELLHYWEES